MTIDPNRIRRESIRWHLLVVANISRPHGVYIEAMLPVINAVYHDASAHELKRELDYLEEREMVHIRKDPTGRWFVELTRHGIDLVEYTSDVQPGIARPSLDV